jgi:hypothetical protein
LRARVQRMRRPPVAAGERHAAPQQSTLSSGSRLTEMGVCSPLPDGRSGCVSNRRFLRLALQPSTAKHVD